MAPRNKQPCRNCPKKITSPPPTVVEVTISSESEAKKIWGNILSASALSIGLIETYIQLDLPGMNIASIRALRTRLDTLIAHLPEIEGIKT